jgi:hypothetical protein
VEEYAALQQFPAGWSFSGSVAQQYVQIGNAVPIGVGAAVGRMLRRVMGQSDRLGNLVKHPERRGMVLCDDEQLSERMKHQRVTQLNPPHLRDNPDPNEARRWLQASA